jgi:hypothetical protein
VNVIRTNKLSGGKVPISMLGATAVLAALFNQTRAEIEQQLVSGLLIETNWYTYQVEHA